MSRKLETNRGCNNDEQIMIENSVAFSKGNRMVYEEALERLHREMFEIPNGMTERSLSENLTNAIALLIKSAIQHNIDFETCLSMASDQVAWEIY